VKKVLIVIGVLVGAFLAVVGGSWLATSAALAQGDKVIEAISDGDEAALGSMMSREIRQKSDPATLLRMARDWGLGGARKVAWETWSIEAGGAKLNGTVTRADGKEQRVVVTLTKQDQAWKLLDIEARTASDVPDPQAQSQAEKKPGG
jgi:hypothetical protein